MTKNAFLLSVLICVKLWLPAYADSGAPIRLACDQAVRQGIPVDANTGQSPIFTRGDTVEFQLGFFANGAIVTNWTNISSATLAVFAVQNDTNAPLMLTNLPVTAAGFNTNCSASNWTNGAWTYTTNQHLDVTFGTNLTSISIGGQASQGYWLRVFLTTTNAGIITALEGPITVQDGPIGPGAAQTIYNQIIVDPLANLVTPTNFFAQNSNLLNAAVGPVPLPSYVLTNRESGAALTSLTLTNATNAGGMFGLQAQSLIFWPTASQLYLLDNNLGNGIATGTSLGVAGSKLTLRDSGGDFMFLSGGAFTAGSGVAFAGDGSLLTNLNALTNRQTGVTLTGAFNTPSGLVTTWTTNGFVTTPIGQFTPPAQLNAILASSLTNLVGFATIGDSYTSGAGATSLLTTWPLLTASKLPGVVGCYYAWNQYVVVPSHPINGVFTNGNPDIGGRDEIGWSGVLTGNPYNTNGAAFTIQVSNAVTATLYTSAYPGLGSASQLSVIVDGGTITSNLYINPSAAAWHSNTIPLGTPGPHTILLTNLTGQCFLFGGLVAMQNLPGTTLPATNGFIIENMGIGSHGLEGNPVYYGSNLFMLRPGVVIVNSGYNEEADSLNTNNFWTNFSYIEGMAVTNGGVAIPMTQPLGAYPEPAALVASFNQQILNTLTNPVLSNSFCLRWDNLWSTNQATNLANGLLAPATAVDPWHPTDAGNASVADGLILPAVFNNGVIANAPYSFTPPTRPAFVTNLALTDGTGFTASGSDSITFATGFSPLQLASASVGFTAYCVSADAATGMNPGDSGQWYDSDQKNCGYIYGFSGGNATLEFNDGAPDTGTGFYNIGLYGSPTSYNNFHIIATITVPPGL